MTRHIFRFKTWLIWMAGVCLLVGVGMAQRSAEVQAIPAHEGSELPEGTPLSWAQDAVRNELNVIDAADKVPLRYRQRKVDAKGDVTREVIESKEGSVARLVERDGQPITAAEDAAERARLMEDIRSPDDFLRHRRRNNEIRDSVVKLVGMLPQAMSYSYAPGQPQPKGVDGQQVVLDFHPNPAFRPPTMFADALTGLEGRVWIDERTHTITRIEAHVLHPVDMGFGLVAKIYPGGTIELEQMHLTGDQWVYSHLDEHMTARVLMMKTLPENNVMTSWDWRPMPSLMSYEEAVRLLLAMPIPVR
jgi:hypothetical protein